MTNFNFIQVANEYNKFNDRLDNLPRKTLQTVRMGVFAATLFAGLYISERYQQHLSNPTLLRFYYRPFMHDCIFKQFLSPSINYAINKILGPPNFKYSKEIANFAVATAHALLAYDNNQNCAHVFMLEMATGKMTDNVNNLLLRIVDILLLAFDNVQQNETSARTMLHSVLFCRLVTNLALSETALNGYKKITHYFYRNLVNKPIFKSKNINRNYIAVPSSSHIIENPFKKEDQKIDVSLDSNALNSYVQKIPKKSDTKKNKDKHDAEKFKSETAPPFAGSLPIPAMGILQIPKKAMKTLKKFYVIQNKNFYDLNDPNAYSNAESIKTYKFKKMILNLRGQAAPKGNTVGHEKYYLPPIHEINAHPAVNSTAIKLKNLKVKNSKTLTIPKHEYLDIYLIKEYRKILMELGYTLQSVSSDEKTS